MGKNLKAFSHKLYFQKIYMKIDLFKTDGLISYLFH